MNLYYEIKSYSPKSLSELQLRNQRTTNIQEGFYNYLKQKTKNEIFTLKELFEVVKHLYATGAMNSMPIKPEQLSKVLSTNKNLGHLAFVLLEKNLQMQ